MDDPIHQPVKSLTPDQRQLFRELVQQVIVPAFRGSLRITPDMHNTAIDYLIQCLEDHKHHER